MQELNTRKLASCSLPYLKRGLYEEQCESNIELSLVCLALASVRAKKSSISAELAQDDSFIKRLIALID